MEFTELEDYPLPAGTVTRWVPTVDAPDAWRVDERPLAYTHEAHCRHSLALAADGGSDENGAAWIGAAFEIHERPDPEALRRALRRWTSRHEAFRSTVTGGGPDSDGSAPLTRSTVPEDAVDVVSSPGGTFLSGSEVRRAILDFFGRSLSPFHWPHCVVATVSAPTDDPDDADPGFLLVFGADHSVMDAYSMLLAVSELRRLYEFEVHGRDPELAVTGSHLDYSVVDRRTGDRLTADHDVVRTWSTFLRDGKFPPFPLPVADDRPGPSRQANLSRPLLDADDTATLARGIRVDGRSMTAAVVGALALATRDVAHTTRLRFAMPMHTRFEPQYSHSVGWYVGVVPVDVHVEKRSTFGDAAMRAATSLESVKGYARQPYSRVSDLLGIESAPRFVVSYLDLRHTPDSESWPRWRTRTLRSGASSRDEVYFWILRTPRGLSIAARFPGHEVAGANVTEFVDRFREILRAAVRDHTGIDPTDTDRSETGALLSAQATAVIG